MSILRRLSKLMNGPSDAPLQTKEDEKLAAAALMVEVASHDGEISRVEREHIMRLLQDKMDLNEAEALELFVDALATQDDSNHILGFTRKIKDHFDEAGREKIIELLWEVVFADGEEDAYESNLLRRVAGLLYVSDKTSGMIRKKVIARRQAN